jgi:hypothetical protein
MVLATLCLFAGSPHLPAQSSQRAHTAQRTQPGSPTCAGCHGDFSSVLPKEHPAVNGSGLGACVECHSIGQSGEAKKNALSTRMHLAHAARQQMQCAVCHVYVPGKRFGLSRQSVSWGAPEDDDMALIKEKFASWANSGFTDHLHARAMIDCGGCHGRQLPVLDSTVENSRCLACHGPLEKLAAKTAPKEFPKRNPHQSHLGDIACTVCHHVHSAARLYCLDCHKNFNLPIPGGGTQ